MAECRTKQYFVTCKSETEIKSEYRKLAFKCHPDHGGSTASFQELTTQYNNSLKKLQDSKKPKMPNMPFDSFTGRASEFDFLFDDWMDRMYDQGDYKRKEPEQKVTYSWSKKINTHYPNALKSALRQFIRETNSSSYTNSDTQLRGFIKIHSKKHYFATTHDVEIELRCKNKQVLELTIQLFLKQVIKQFE